MLPMCASSYCCRAQVDLPCYMLSFFSDGVLFRVLQIVVETMAIYLNNGLSWDEFESGVYLGGRKNWVVES